MFSVPPDWSASHSLLPYLVMSASLLLSALVRDVSHQLSSVVACDVSNLLSSALAGDFGSGLADEFSKRIFLYPDVRKPLSSALAGDVVKPPLLHTGWWCQQHHQPVMGATLPGGLCCMLRPSSVHQDLGCWLRQSTPHQSLYCTLDEAIHI